MELPQIVSKLRQIKRTERHGLARLARKAGVALSTVYRVIDGGKPNERSLHAIAAALNGKGAR